MSTTFDLIVHARTAAPWEPSETILRTYAVTVPGERRYGWGALAIAPEDMESAVRLARKAAGESIPAPSIPKPPAPDTAAASAGVSEPVIGPWTMGRRSDRARKKESGIAVSFKNQHKRCKNNS